MRRADRLQARAWRRYHRPTRFHHCEPTNHMIANRQFLPKHFMGTTPWRAGMHCAGGLRVRVSSPVIGGHRAT
jgi:hypothetical protein